MLLNRTLLGPFSWLFGKTSTSNRFNAVIKKYVKAKQIRIFQQSAKKVLIDLWIIFSKDFCYLCFLVEFCKIIRCDFKGYLRQKNVNFWKCSLSVIINPLRANITKWSNTLKQFVGKLLECVWPFCGIGI